MDPKVDACVAISSCVDIDGFAIIHPVLTSEMCDAISASLSQIPNKGIGSRSLLDMPWCGELAKFIREHPVMSRSMPREAVAVQCTYFEKSQHENWLVPIHQDLSIPVQAKVDHPALTGWSEKQGCVFVQAPDRILDELVAVRLHIDECGEDDGPLRLVPGSHKTGRLSNEDAIQLRDRQGEVVCTVARGGALLIKPLVLHASSKATGHGRRRVLHFVFAPSVLPFGLRWHYAV